MTRNGTAGTRVLALAFLASTAGLAGCADIDNSLVGTPGLEHVLRPSPPSQGLPDAGATSSGAPSVAPAPTDVKPVAVDEGANTGTPVGQKVQTIRTDLQAVEAELASDTQRFDALKLAAAQAAQTYHESTSHIALRLQVGTTPANPELVDDWNQAQGALDTLSQTIDGLNALTTTIQSNAAHAQNDRDAIKAASATSGGVDDDRTQLAKLQAETDQTLSAIDRLNADVSQEARRQGGYLSSERAGQVALQAAITSGDASGVAPAPAPAPAAPVPADAAAPAPATSPPPVRYSEPTGAPIATVVFDKPKVAFEQSLYASLNQALAGHPNISFTVVAVAPVAKTTEAMITAQTDAQHHAQEVVHAMTSMGVPAGRIAISSSTDPTVSTSQVRVFGH